MFSSPIGAFIFLINLGVRLEQGQFIESFRPLSGLLFS